MWKRLSRISDTLQYTEATIFTTRKSKLTDRKWSVVFTTLIAWPRVRARDLEPCTINGHREACGQVHGRCFFYFFLIYRLRRLRSASKRCCLSVSFCSFPQFPLRNGTVSDNTVLWALATCQSVLQKLLVNKWRVIELPVIAPTSIGR